MTINKNVLEAIGNTSLVKLNKVVPKNCASILVKLEWENPTGSMKDRMAQAMITRAEQDGRLSPGGTVVEYTGGSTGASLALICAVKGYNIKIVSWEGLSPTKLNHMATLGAEINIVPNPSGKITRELVDKIISTAKELSEQSNTYWTNQLENEDHIAGYETLGEEIWKQSNGNIDAFVHCVGTSASLQGTTRSLKKYKSDVKIIAVEPQESAFLSKGVSGSHGIEGIGIGYEPPLWNNKVANDIASVSTQDAINMSKKLSKEEGLFAGISSGANVKAAIEIGKELGPDHTVVTLLIDSGLKYLDNEFYVKN